MHIWSNVPCRCHDPPKALHAVETFDIVPYGRVHQISGRKHEQHAILPARERSNQRQTASFAQVTKPSEFTPFYHLHLAMHNGIYMDPDITFRKMIIYRRLVRSDLNEK